MKMDNIKKIIQAIYGPTFSPREIIITAIVVVVILKWLGL